MTADREAPALAPGLLDQVAAALQSLDRVRCSPEDAAELASVAPASVKPIFTAVAVAGLALAVICPEGGSIAVPAPDPPGLLVAIADMAGGGPSVFDSHCAALLAVADDVLLVTVTPEAEHFGSAAAEACRGRVTVMIVARPECRGAWLDAITETAPGARLAVFAGGDAAAWARPGGSA
ncbi:MAG: hypothetical protein ACLQJR_11765 [Stellaceae bacterium]